MTKMTKNLDTQLLDALTVRAAPGLKWTCRWSTTGRGLRLHQDPSGAFDTPRHAIAGFLDGAGTGADAESWLDGAFNNPLAALDALTRELEDQKRGHLRTIDQRDAAEDALGDAYALVTGNQPEWSNIFGYADAMEDITNTIAAQSARIATLEHDAVMSPRLPVITCEDLEMARTEERARLAPFLKHQEFCPGRGHTNGRIAMEVCHCGLRAALAPKEAQG